MGGPVRPLPASFESRLIAGTRSGPGAEVFAASPAVATQSEFQPQKIPEATRPHGIRQCAAFQQHPACSNARPRTDLG